MNIIKSKSEKAYKDSLLFDINAQFNTH